MLQDFAKTIRLDAGPDAVWDAVNDVRRVASWVSIVREVRDVDPPRRYAALLEDRLGPFAMRADLDIAVERDGRRMRVTASGEDRQVASRISATIELAVEADGTGTSLAVTGRYEVTGKVATLGAAGIDGSVLTEEPAELNGLLDGGRLMNVEASQHRWPVAS